MTNMCNRQEDTEPCTQNKAQAFCERKYYPASGLLSFLPGKGVCGNGKNADKFQNVFFVREPVYDQGGSTDTFHLVTQASSTLTLYGILSKQKVVKSAVLVL